jgi:hypothetical protein
LAEQIAHKPLWDMVNARIRCGRGLAAQRPARGIADGSHAPVGDEPAASALVFGALLVWIVMMFVVVR